jgi:ice-binding like protein/exosortase sorting signal-containing protein
MQLLDSVQFLCPRKFINHLGQTMYVQTAATIQSRHVAPRVAETRAEARFSRNPGLLARLGLIALLALAPYVPAFAATAPSLGTESTYAIVSSTFTNANTPPQSIVTGDICYTTPPVTAPVTHNGVVVGPPCPPQTGVDQGDALATLNGQPCTSLGAGAVALDSVIVGSNPPGVIPPGCYSSGGAMNVTLSTNVVLNGVGVYIFRPGGALDTGANSNVILANGACASDVFWAPVGATTLGANAAQSLAPTFVGNILDASGITIGHFANLMGRALAFGGTVTTDAVTISAPACAPLRAVGSVPTLSQWAMITLVVLLAVAGFAAMRRRSS